MVPKLSPITDSILKVLSVQAVVVVFGDVTKKPFVATLIISFIWGSTTFHVDDPLFKSNKDRPPVARHSSVHAKIKPPKSQRSVQNIDRLGDSTSARGVIEVYIRIGNDSYEVGRLRKFVLDLASYKFLERRLRPVST